MNKLILPVLLLYVSHAHSQVVEGTTYYSDKYASREVSRGAYQKEITKVNDSVFQEVFTKSNSGQKIWEKYYLKEQPYGLWKWYDKKGNVTSERSYDFVLKYGAFRPENSYTLEDLGIDLGEDINAETIQNHLRKNFRYPEVAQKNGIQGRVTMQFTIDENGQIANMSILKGVHPSLETEFFRIMHLLKELLPYEKDGQKVMVYYTLPLTFRLV